MAEVIMTIICDDIRREVGNKISLMGMYDNTIRVPQFPFVFQRLGFVQKWKSIKELEMFRLEIKVEGSNPLIIEGDINIPPKKGKSAAEPIAQFLVSLNNIKVHKPCTMTFFVIF